MNTYALHHEAKSSMAYAYDKDTLHIKLRTKINDFKKVTLIWGDPFKWVKREDGTHHWDYSSIAENTMIKRGGTRKYDYYFITVKPTLKRCKYAFLLTDKKGKKYIYGTREIVPFDESDDTPIKNNMNFFNFPYIYESDVNTRPEWVKDTIWYQIFPERFAKGTEKDCLPWNSIVEGVSNNHRFGGDIRGVINQLPYIKSLGISGFYFTPIFLSPSTHKYDIIDYFMIDPAFGTNEDFKELVQKAHELGIKVMLDAVFNHCSNRHPFFEDVVKNEKNSIYEDCFFIRKYPIRTDFSKMDHWNHDIDYETFAFAKGMPKWNTDNKIAAEYLLKSVEYWIKEYDIDGWRFDVSNEVSHSFLRDCKKVAVAAKKDIFLIGENWDNANPWVAGDQFNSVMNYELYFRIQRHFYLDNQSANSTSTDFRDEVNELLFQYPDNVTEIMFNLLGCHDTARALRKCGDNIDLFKLPLAFLFTVAGAPNIYYGDEVGITGGHDPDCRRCMVWDPKEQNQDLLSFTKCLISIRNEYSATKAISIKWLLNDDDTNTTIYQKQGKKDIFVILHNKATKDSIKLPKNLRNRKLINLLTDTQKTLGEEIVLDGYCCYIFGQK